MAPPVGADRRLILGVAYESSPDGSHEHVAGVSTAGGHFWTRGDVLRSLQQGEAWWALVDGRRMVVRQVDHCPWPGCGLVPYVHVPATGRPAGRRGPR